MWNENSLSLATELLGLKEGLGILNDKGLLRVIIESDSSQAINLVHGFSKSDHPLLSIVLDCKRVHKLLWSCSIDHVSRNYNQCAHAMALLAHDFDDQGEMHMFTSPHVSVVQIFLNDNMK